MFIGFPATPDEWVELGSLASASEKVLQVLLGVRLNVMIFVKISLRSKLCSETLTSEKLSKL